MDSPTVTPQGLLHWRQVRRRLMRNWILFLGSAAFGGGLLIINVPRGDPWANGAFVLILLLGLRGAWKTEQQIRACDKTLG